MASKILAADRPAAVPTIQFSRAHYDRLNSVHCNLHVIRHLMNEPTFCFADQNTNCAAVRLIVNDIEQTLCNLASELFEALMNAEEGGVR